MIFHSSFLGLLPLVFDREGAGSLWAPLAVTVIGGLSASTVLVLFILPGLYHLTQDCVSWIKIRFPIFFVSDAAKYGKNP